MKENQTKYKDTVISARNFKPEHSLTQQTKLNLPQFYQNLSTNPKNKAASPYTN